jgi:hypothetical protein
MPEEIEIFVFATVEVSFGAHHPAAILWVKKAFCPVG